MNHVIEGLFPALHGQPWSISSPPDEDYNCIAWAGGDASQIWWPDAAGEHFWPEGLARIESLEAFSAAFAALGYAACDDDSLEPGFEKVAFFTFLGAPKHAARQLDSGRWTSKLGPREDIEHDLHDLTGLIYGSVALVMKRPRQAPP